MRKFLSKASLLFPSFSQNKAAYIRTSLLLSGVFCLEQAFFHNNFKVRLTETEEVQHLENVAEAESAASIEKKASEAVQKYQYNDAIILYQKALQIRLAQTNDLDKDVLILRTLLADAQHLYGDYKGALATLSENADKIVGTFGEESAEHVKLLNQIGNIHDSYKSIENALENKLKALSIAKKVYGKNDALYAELLLSLCETYLKHEKHQKALETAMQALSIFAIADNKNEQVNADALRILALSQFGTGLKDQGVTTITEAYEKFKNNAGEDDPRLIKFYDALVPILLTSDPEQAFDFKIKALELTEKVYGKEASATALQYLNTGMLMGELGQIRSAQEYLKRSFRILRKNHGAIHPDSATVLKELAINSLQQENPELAGKRLETLLEIRYELNPGADLETAKVWDLYGDALNHMAEFEASVDALKTSLDLKKMLLDENDDEIAKQHLRIANVLAVAGEVTRCKKAMKTAYEFIAKKYGRNHEMARDIKDEYKVCEVNKNRF